MNTIKFIVVAALILGFSKIDAQMMHKCMMQDSAHSTSMMQQGMMGGNMMGQGMTCPQFIYCLQIITRLKDG